jgi:hypothetical protein
VWSWLKVGYFFLQAHVVEREIQQGSQATVKRLHALARCSVLKLAVCAPVTDSGVICLHRSVTGIPEVGVVGNAGRTGSIDSLAGSVDIGATPDD